MSCFQNWDIQCGVDSNIISNEEGCGNNSSNDKIWWRPLPSDGTSLAIKQEINIRRLLRSLHAFFWHPDKKCPQNLDIILYWAERNLQSSPFRFANSFFIGYHILHLFKHLSTLENITTLRFPNICINSPWKAYFDYITRPFVKINNIFSIGACYFPCSIRKIVATLKFK